LIPLYKLDKLPRTQKLRKIAKYFTFAENRLGMANNTELVFTDAEFAFFTDAARLLAEDKLFSHEAQKIFCDAAVVFQAADKSETVLLRRSLNNIKHILLAETGKDQADWDFTCPGGKLDPDKRHIFKGMYVYLEDIRSPFNIGAMFRTAESFGVEKIILSPFCASPHHRRAERTAMGCIDILPWEQRDLFAAQSENNKPAEETPLPVFALETGGIPIKDFAFPRNGILIAGSEELGVSPNALAAADASLGRVSIPCYGTKASLNVSVAFGIALQVWSARIETLS